MDGHSADARAGGRWDPPTARFVLFYSYDDWFESIDMLDSPAPANDSGLQYERA